MEFIDGKPVVNHLVRFRNRVDINDEAAKAVKDGEIVFWLLRARCLPPQYCEAGDGDDRYRLNIQAVEAAAPIQGQLRDEANTYLLHGGDAQGYFSLDIPRFPDGDNLFAQKDRQLAEITEIVKGADTIREGENVVDAVRRLLQPQLSVLEAPEISPIDDDSVERVGSIYGPNHSGRNRAVLETAFGE